MNEEMKDKILNKAFEMFAENGYEATSINNICKVLNISKGAVYHYFSSKEDLLISVFKELIVKDLCDDVGKVDVSSRENLKKDLIKLGAQYISPSNFNVLRKKFSMQMPYIMSRNEKLMKQGIEYFEESLSIINNAMKRIADSQLVNDFNPDLMAQKMVMIMDALELYAALGFGFSLESIWIDFVEKNF